MEKNRIAAIALDHAARGIYDNSCAKSGTQRNAYAAYWTDAVAAIAIVKE